MSRFYIATGRANIAQHNAMRDALIELGHEITHDWTAHLDGERLWEQIAVSEAQGVEEADFVVVIQPGYIGTAAEMGMAIGHRKPVFLLTVDSLTRTKMQDDELCDSPFYHHPCVIHIDTPDNYDSNHARDLLLLRSAAITIQSIWLRDHA